MSAQRHFEDIIEKKWTSDDSDDTFEKIKSSLDQMCEEIFTNFEDKLSPKTWDGIPSNKIEEFNRIQQLIEGGSKTSLRRLINVHKKRILARIRLHIRGKSFPNFESIKKMFQQALIESDWKQLLISSRNMIIIYEQKMKIHRILTRKGKKLPPTFDFCYITLPYLVPDLIKLRKGSESDIALNDVNEMMTPIISELNLKATRQLHKAVNFIEDIVDKIVDEHSRLNEGASNVPLKSILKNKSEVSRTNTRKRTVSHSKLLRLSVTNGEKERRLNPNIPKIEFNLFRNLKIEIRRKWLQFKDELKKTHDTLTPDDMFDIQTKYDHLVMFVNIVHCRYFNKLVQWFDSGLTEVYRRVEEEKI